MADGSQVGRLEVVVSGRVQGVGFRWFVVSTAEALGVTGWVANARDGSVRVVAEGPQDALESLVGRLRQGPPGAQVRDVRSVPSPPTGEFTSFGIRASSHPGD